MIKMSDICSIDADFERLEISFLSEKNVLLGTVRYFDLLQLKEKYNEMIGYFMESLEGKKINIRLPYPQKLSPEKKSYGSGNLFMEYSGGEKSF